ncbi:toll/interleukin-1 receptor domain-containing protein [Streptomyces sp. WMMB303]|uniref:toll/interleukin-1 receptor domain-containing protein n=1 Tax=Streptomyces sp. WMMB303 TaxID=3034154 RepID=UPI0023EA9CE5|nr:toll/interleukin-1 receptor domain-containing protein [Streptomyces sp. WMMB303]MDF4254372.1 toll/interleukin-1 receptor domain-containing protein [Streptomyces sp. WMMB303]
MHGIFINYRKEGGAYAAALLDELLSRRFGQDQVFRAAKSIPPGSEYSDAIRVAVMKCAVMLVVIDEGWVEYFEREVCNPSVGKGWVAEEIKVAIKSDRILIPVLLTGVKFPTVGRLPKEVSRVAGLQYLRFDYRNTRQDVEFMSEWIVSLCPKIQRIRDESG